MTQHTGSGRHKRTFTNDLHTALVAQRFAVAGMFMAFIVTLALALTHTPVSPLMTTDAMTLVVFIAASANVARIRRDG